MLEAEATRCMTQGQGTLWPLSYLRPKQELKNKKIKKKQKVIERGQPQSRYQKRQRKD